MSPRSPAALMLLLVVGVAALVVAVDLTVPPPSADPAGPPEPDDAPSQVTGGAWTCAVGDGREGTELAVSAVGPAPDVTQPGRVQIGSFGDGDLRLGEPTRVRPGTALRPGLEGEEIATFARWYEQPVTLYRHWRIAGDDDLPPGRAEGPCLSEDSDRWWIPGMSTAGGHEARLRLANPYESDATVAVRLLTPEGPVEPTVLQNLTVLGRSTTEIEINEHLPERDDVAVDVQVVAGRVAAEGYQLVRQAIGDVDGVSLLASAARPSSTWTVPWVAAGENRQSWLWLLNPGDRPASVELTLHGPDGGRAPEGLAEATVEPGQLRRIDLRGTFPEGLTSAAVTVRSEAVPVIASGVARLQPDDPAESGMAVQLGGQPHTSWIVAGGSTTGREEQLRLVNPGSEVAVVDVTVWDGTETRQPDGLTGVEVPPGAMRVLDLAGELGGVEEWSALAEVQSGQLVVGHVGQGGGDARELVAGVGASPARTPAGPVLVPRHDPGLTQRLGTGRTADDELPEE